VSFFAKTQVNEDVKKCTSNGSKHEDIKTIVASRHPFTRSIKPSLQQVHFCRFFGIL
jgi:hypothetical protein